MPRLVIRGSDPPAPYPKFLNTMLMDAVAAKWDTYCPDPPAANEANDNNGVVFFDVEPPAQNDIELWFDLIVDDRDPGRRPLGWGIYPCLAAVMIHVNCKGDSVEKIPDYMPAIVDAVENVIEVEGKALIPHTDYITLVRTMDAPRYNLTERRFQTNCQVNISYTKSIVVV